MPRPSSLGSPTVPAAMRTLLRGVLPPLRAFRSRPWPAAGKWWGREGVLGTRHVAVPPTPPRSFHRGCFLSPQMFPFEPRAMAPACSTPNTSPPPRCRRRCWPRALLEWRSMTRIATVRQPTPALPWGGLGSGRALALP